MSDLVYHKKCKKCKREFASNYERSNPCNTCQGEVKVIHTEKRGKFLQRCTPLTDTPQVSVAYKSIVYTEGHIGNSTVKECEERITEAKFKLKMYKRFAKEQGWKDEDHKS